jgi:hypothetical protein
MNLNYQNYLHYKLPITMNPLEYGNVIEQFNNKYIIQLSTSNVLIIKQTNNDNYIKFFRKGELMFEFKDTRISDNRFTRTILDQKYTFRDGKLLSTEIMSSTSNIMIYNSEEFYVDSDSVLLKPSTPLENVHKYLENTNIYKNYKAELFILFELFLIFLVYLICFVIFPENNVVASLSTGGIIKLRKRKSIHSWNTVEFSIENLLFTSELFKSKFNQFWDKVNPRFNDNNHMFILFKIKYKGSDYATIGNLQRLNSEDKEWYYNWIINNMIYKSEYYNETPIISFIFSYGFLDKKLEAKEIFSTKVNFQKYENNKLVVSYNPLDFGKLVSEIKFENYTKFILQTSDNLLVNINKFEEFNEVELFSGGNIILKFRDEFISKNKFVRVLENKKYYFENNKQILFIKETKTKFISKISPTKNLVNKFLTLDIETYVKDGILIPYCISIFDGVDKKNFFLMEYKNLEDMIISALKSIMIRKYHRYNVYVHNLAKFDIIFLLKYLVKLGSVHPVIHNQRIISINFNFSKNGAYQLHFRDSYLILLASLWKLCKSFNVENSKSIFPHFFVSENNLDYEGKVPEFKYFKGINISDYNNYRKSFKNNWNLKNEAIKYCNLDCISLHQVITRFSNMIFDLFARNVHHYPTLPSLAFAIFRSNFMTEENIPQLTGKIADDIRQSYTGGAVDMYIPKPLKDVKVKCYDVNSLYPSRMKDCLMPVGTPSYFKGDIRKLDLSAFGFFYCKIIAPDNIKHPIIQTHVKTSNGIRTISPIGVWEDMIFSEEMDNAIKYGYKFNILWGYTFDKKIIFSDYVDFLYNMRLQYSKTDPMNHSSKILLNSLYGRFGMEDNFAEIDIIHKDFYADFENRFLNNILETQDLGDYKLVRYQTFDDVDNEDSNHNVSVAVASAITAYSRIHMSQFKNNPKINLYYSDTDSIYTDSELDDILISNTDLGKLKLENSCNDAVFLAPKLYCLKTEDNEVIYKVKGLKHEVELTMKDFEHLLYKNAIIEKSQTKWFRNLSEGHIKLLETIYTLKVTDNKRKLIYDNHNKLIGTSPYVINENKEIINK